MRPDNTKTKRGTTPKEMHVETARVSALLTDTPEKVASEPEIATRAKSAKCNRTFGDVQEEEENESFCVDCVEPTK
jgi:hypothetical protein